MKEETILEAKMRLANMESNGAQDSSFGIVESGLFNDDQTPEWAYCFPTLELADSASSDMEALP
jgi:hypothetical protein